MGFTSWLDDVGNSRLSPQWTAGIVSFLISIAVTLATPLVNTDGILYLRVAEAFQEGGYEAASELFAAPFYSILIAMLSDLLGCSVAWSAGIINAFACGALAWLLVDLGEMIGGSRIAAWGTAILLLLHPQFNEYRSFVIRDFVFWASCIGFVNLQVRAYLTLKSVYIVGAAILLLFAGLFRVEAFLFLPLPVVTLIFMRRYPGIIRITLIPYAVMACLGVLLLLALLMMDYPVWESMMRPLGRIYASATGFSDQLIFLNESFQQNLLRGYLEDYSIYGVLAAFLVMLMASVLKSFTLPYVILTYFMVRSVGQFRFSQVRITPVWVFWIFYFFAVYLFVISDRVIQGRHTILLTFLIMPVLGALFEYWMTLHRQSSVKAQKRRVYTCAFFVVYLLLDSFVSFGVSKIYLKDSSDWLKNSYAHECRLLTNSSKIGYYSSLEVNWGDLNQFRRSEKNLPKVLNGADLVAVELKHKSESQKAFEQLLPQEYSKVAEFGDDRGVIVYQYGGQGAACSSVNP